MTDLLGHGTRARLAALFAIAMFLLNGHLVGKYRGALAREASAMAMNPQPTLLPAGVPLPPLLGRAGDKAVTFPDDTGVSASYLVLVITKTCWGCAQVLDRMSSLSAAVRTRVALVDLTSRGGAIGPTDTPLYPAGVTVITQPDVTSQVAYNMRVVPQLLEIGPARRLLSVNTGEAGVLRKLDAVSATFGRR